MESLRPVNDTAGKGSIVLIGHDIVDLNRHLSPDRVVNEEVDRDVLRVLELLLEDLFIDICYLKLTYIKSSPFILLFVGIKKLPASGRCHNNRAVI